MSECSADEIPPSWRAEDEAARLGAACDGDSGVDRRCVGEVDVWGRAVRL